jgi:hypothetical protein
MYDFFDKTAVEIPVNDTPYKDKDYSAEVNYSVIESPSMG